MIGLEGNEFGVDMKIVDHEKWRALDDIFSRMWTVRRNDNCFISLLTDDIIILLMYLFDSVNIAPLW